MIRPSFATAIQAAILIGLVCAAAGRLVDSWAPPQRARTLRTTVKAGSWYERQPDRLQAQLTGLLTQADPLINTRRAAEIGAGDPPVKGRVLALLCPHAAYMYSGVAAARAYRLVAQQPIHRIFVLGPLHKGRLHGVALPTCTAFALPGGAVRVDTKAVGELSTHRFFALDDLAHESEYSLEMQLPFIRQVFGDVAVVPILVGRLEDQAEIEQVAQTLRSMLSADDLVVVSSDFTHWGAIYKYEPFHDNIRANVGKLDAAAYGFIRRRDLTGFLEWKKETKDNVCGFYACCVLMAMLPESSRSTVIDYYTSQDAVGTASKLESERSVSYLPIAFCDKSWTKTGINSEKQ